MSDLPANKPYGVCPKHGIFPLSLSDIGHVYTSQVLPGGNPELPATNRRKTPRCYCPGDMCDKKFTCLPMSRVYDIPIKFTFDTDSDADISDYVGSEEGSDSESDED